MQAQQNTADNLPAPQITVQHTPAVAFGDPDEETEASGKDGGSNNYYSTGYQLYRDMVVGNSGQPFQTISERLGPCIQGVHNSI